MFKTNTNFIVISQKRSGSTLLCDGLNQHSSINCYNEPVNNNLYSRIEDTAHIPNMEVLKDHNDKIAWIKRFIKTRKFSGFKILSHHLTDDERQKVLNLPVKKIILFRENELARTVSDLTGKQTKIFNTEDENVQHKLHSSPMKIQVPMSVLNDNLSNSELFFKQHESSGILISYNNLTVNWDKTLKEMFHFLEVPFEKVSQRKLKLRSTPLSYRIENLEEVTTFLSERSCKWMLEDEH